MPGVPIFDRCFSLPSVSLSVSASVRLSAAALAIHALPMLARGCTREHRTHTPHASCISSPSTSSSQHGVHRAHSSPRQRLRSGLSTSADTSRSKSVRVTEGLLSRPSMRTIAQLGARVLMCLESAVNSAYSRSMQALHTLLNCGTRYSNATGNRVSLLWKIWRY